jgi:hypothetical protein
MALGEARMAILIRGLAAALAGLLALRFVPSAFCARHAGRLYDGDAALAAKAMRGAGKQIAAPIELARFDTGNPRYDAEWRFVTYVSAAYAAAQVAAEHPAEGADARLILSTAVERALTRDARVYDTDAWSQDAIDSLDSAAPTHGGVLGYLCLALALEARIAPVPEHVTLELKLRGAIARRLQASAVAPGSGLLATYPNETYPADNAPAIACLALGDAAELAQAIAAQNTLTTRYLDKSSGLLIQFAGGAGVTVAGAPRASGSAFAAYFLSIAGADLAKNLHTALQRQTTEILGFGGVREFVKAGHGDVDSGPLVFGMSPSASAFMLGSSRAQRDRRSFRTIYASAHLFGMPIDNANSRNSVVGGPVADAILAAMVTARPAGAWRTNAATDAAAKPVQQ